MNTTRKSNFLSAVLALLLIGQSMSMMIPEGVAAGTIDQASEPAGNNAGAMLQFTSGGHVLGFGSQSVYLAGLDHALKVEFAGGNQVQPAAEGADKSQNGASPLGRVTYRGVWKNTDVIYSAVEGGVAESSYIVRPGGNPRDISLKYNVPAELLPSGKLSFKFESGYITEDAPVAWQEIGGKRQPVEVGYIMLANNRVGFHTGSYDVGYDLYIDPAYQWHTFYGSASGTTVARRIALDSANNVYVTGYSAATWNGPGPTSPLNAYIGNSDIVVIKLNSAGAYQWHTFYGSTNVDEGHGITLDSANNVYVAGWSFAAWDGPGPTSPLNAYTGGREIVILKLNSAGAYQWHTFYGTAGADEGHGIDVDSANNVYVTGYSDATWDGPGPTPPLNAHAAYNDIVIIKLNSAGAYQWHTFYGTAVENDEGHSIALDSSNNVYVTGYSRGAWNGPGPTSPLNAYTGSGDIVIIKLNSSGAYQWHTFCGAAGVSDVGRGIALDSANNVYVTGESPATWDGPGPTSPLNAYTGSSDIVVIKLNSAGAYQWHTFYGSVGNDYGYGIAVDSANNVYVTGWSPATWNGPGSVPPINAYAGSTDIVIIKLSNAGAYGWHTFYGSAGSGDYGYGIAVDSADDIYAAGYSVATWNGPGPTAPLNAFTTGAWNAVILKMTESTVPTFTSAATNVAGNTITITFSKNMANPAGKHGEFSYKINGGSAQTFSAAALNADNTKIDLTCSGPVISFGDTVTVSYTRGSVLAADGGILASFTDQAVTNNMIAPPTFTSAATNTAGNTITITFSKNMANPAGKHGEFSYKINGGSAQTFSAAALNADNTKIDLTCSGTAIAYGNTVTVSYTRGTVAAADGGVLGSFTDQAVTNNMPAPPTLTSAATNVAGTVITITFSKNMANPAGKHGEFNYRINGGAAQSFSAAALNADNTKFDLTCSGTAIVYGNTVTVSYTKGTVVAADGGILASFTNQPVTNNLVAPPIVTSAATNAAGTIITITFSKNMADPAGKQAEFSYKINGGPAQTFSAAALNANVTKIDLTCSGTAIAYGDTVTVSYTKGTVLAADNGILASFTNRAVTNNMPGPPTVTSAATNAAGTVITITFSKNMADPAGKQAEFSYKINGGGAQTFSAAALNADNTKIDLTCSGTAIVSGNIVTVSYTKGTVLAADNSILASFTDQAVTNNIPIPAPTIITFVPASGTSGTIVIITGTNFTGATAVKFGGTAAASFTINSATQITATVDIGATGNITVTTPGGTATSTGIFTFTLPANLISTIHHGSSVSTTAPAPAPPVSLPTIQVQSASVAGNSQVSAQVANTGGASGNSRIVLYVDGKAVDSQGVSLAPGSTTTVRFDTGSLEPGTHSIKVNNIPAGEVTVANGADHTFFIALAAFLLVMAGLFIAFFRKQRSV